MDLCSHVLFRRRGGSEIAREKTICTQNREILFLPDKFHKFMHVEKSFSLFVLCVASALLKFKIYQNE